MRNPGVRRHKSIARCVLSTCPWCVPLLLAVWPPHLRPEGVKAPLPLEKRTVRGRWVLDHKGEPTLPSSFTRGLQTSALEYLGGRLWSLGDQRSRYPGHIFAIDPTTARLLGPPIRPTFDAKLSASNPECEVYRKIPNSDFEALCSHPGEASTLFAVTEDKVPWIVEIHLDGPDRATFKQFSRLEFPRGLTPWRGDTNFRIEGATIADDGTMYLAFERGDDDLPRILSLELAEARSGGTVRPREVAFPFASVPRRSDKPLARLNVNGLAFFRSAETPCLAAIARDQERILILDAQARRIRKVVDLVLLSPEGRPMHWVSPEGIAVDPAGDRLWLINDPDSVRGNYRALADKSATGPFADYSPLLFEMKFSDVK